ncbi:MAG: phosphotransferase, partial [Gemmatimonadetes bacterium]|nr:phosphotransferase [Gemmatimonadota bacterium]
MNPNTPTAASITHSTVSGEHLCAKVLARYDLDFPVDCVFLQMGCNDTYRVRTGGQTLYLRVYHHGWRSRRQIEAEVEMLDFLSHREQPVSAPVRRRDGRFLTRVSSPEGQRYSVLFTEAPSDRGMRVAEHRDYGSTVAKL